MKCDDICFTHILPRLNGTDVKFLYLVNGETRKLIKRSSRRRELKKKYKVSKMSSISTLEVAWQYIYPWGMKLRKYSIWLANRITFCTQVAKTNKLELLKWAREEKECEWDYKTINTAAEQGNLETVQYCVANQCPISEDVCTDVVSHGRLKVLKYLHEEAKAPWDSEAIVEAYFNCQHDCLQYPLDNDCPLPYGWYYDEDGDGCLHTF